MGDGKRELLWETQEKDEALMAAQCRWNLGEKAFEDDSVPLDKLSSEAKEEHV